MAQRTPDLTLHAVAPTDEVALREWFDLAGAVRAHDVAGDPPGCWVEHRSALSAPTPGEDTTVWLARSGGAAIGMALLSLTTLDNPDIAFAELLVTPDRRRRGVGRGLLTHLADTARAAGRRHLIVEAREPMDEPGPGASFLAAMGAHKALADQRRRLALPDLDRPTLDGLGAAARAAAVGYDLVSWTGATPARWLDDVAALVGRMAIDVPLGDLHITPERWDARRIRDREAAYELRGLHRTTTVARGPEGRLVAYTVIFGTASVDWYANQGDTIVSPDHRGHRLGALVKLANLALVQAEHPALRVIDTYNADANPYMVSINEAMGFRPHDRLGEWELDL